MLHFFSLSFLLLLFLTAKVGGWMGFAIGGSFISFVELIFFIFYLVYVVVKDIQQD